MSLPWGNSKTWWRGPKHALLAQVEARSPRFFRKCIDDPMCGMYAIFTLSMKTRCKICRKLTSVIKHLASGSRTRPPARHQNPRNGGPRSGQPTDVKAGRQVTMEHMDQPRASHHQISSSRWKNKGRRRHVKKRNAKPDSPFSKPRGNSNQRVHDMIRRLG